MDHPKNSKLSAHVAKTIGSFVGLKKEHLHHLSPIPEKLQRLLMRTEEQESKERDQWGNFEHPYAKNTMEGLLWEPEVDLFAKEERERLKKLNIPTAPLWPSGYSFALVLTHDVDYIDLRAAYPQLFRMLVRSYKSADLKAQEKAWELFKGAARFIIKRPYTVQNSKETLQESLSIEKKLEVSASYFFTLYPLEKYSRYDCLYSLKDTVRFEGKKRPLWHILKEMDEEGFDVGLHGSYFSALDKGLLLQQKTSLEDFMQKKVETTRQHWLHLKMPGTLKNQAAAGFMADTTLGYNRNIGYRAGTGFPFRLWDDQTDSPISVLEVPMIIQDGALIGNNALEYSLEKALSVMKEFVKKTESLESCLTLLFHPDIFAKKGLSSLYESIIRYALGKGAFVTNVKTVSRYWDERLQTLGLKD